MKTLTACTGLLAVLGLAACQPAADGTATADAGAAPAQSAAAEASAASGDAIDAHVRAGLWQTTASFPGGGGIPVTSRVCMDETMTALNTGMSQSAEADSCTQNVTRTPDGFAFTGRCEPDGGGVSEMTGTMTGDLQTAYRMEATITTTGAPMAAMNGSTQIVTEAVYQGDCPEGWRAGDVEVEGMGIRINTNDLQAQAARGGG